MAIGAVGDEIDAGRRIQVGLNLAVVHAFGFPHGAQAVAEDIGAQSRRQRHTGTLTGRSHGGIGHIAAKTGMIGTTGLMLVQLNHGLAKANDIHRARHLKITLKQRGLPLLDQPESNEKHLSIDLIRQQP